jgi:large subunit ribosomal protein L17
MRHRVAGFKLSRNTAHRKAMRRNMVIALFTHGQITTTVPKAKSLKPFAEKLITLARQGNLTARRRVLKVLGDPIMITHDDDPNVERNRYGELTGGPRLVKKLFDEIGPKYADRQGGYTRIVRLGRHRLGDGGDLCVIQLVGDEEGPNVAGQYSRRREKADRRMTFAAQLRKGRSSSDDQAAEQPVDAQDSADQTSDSDDANKSAE